MIDIRYYIDESIIRGIAAEMPIRLCGFVVYSKLHPHVIKVLRDDDYWNELDAISGPKWPIFAVRPVSQENGVNRDKNEADEYFVRTCLQLGKEELPCFVCFIWDDRGNLLKVHHVIDDSSIETTHKELTEIVKRVTRVIDAIEPEYMQTENVFRNVEYEVDSFNFHSSVYRIKSRARSTITMFKELLELYKLL